ncbi:hypothetical protein [Pacificispira sp.]|uniref:hypothetical protein n=1 Tax=Pacificispira sp. TaxID=2888761 RepID=UPI003BAA2D71
MQTTKIAAGRYRVEGTNLHIAKDTEHKPVWGQGARWWVEKAEGEPLFSAASLDEARRILGDLHVELSGKCTGGEDV